jgi:aspartate-semialdehyde dehydrogenase
VELNTALARKEEIVECLKSFSGIVVQDDPTKHTYPLNTTASGQDAVYVGRIRQDLFDKKKWLMWIVSDNVRKGAALNGIQIAERLFGR